MKTAIEVLENHLKEAFGAAAVTRHDTAGGPALHVIDGPCSYELKLDEELTAEEAERGLPEWNVAAELRRAEGMPLVLSRSGIRLESGA